MIDKLVNLDVLNALVKELNKQVSIIEMMDARELHADHVVEISKAIGLIGSISSESVALMGDIVKTAKPKTKSDLDNVLDSLLKKDFS